MGNIEKTLAQNIRENSLPDYQANRYDHIRDGEILTFNNEDLSGVDFGNFNMGFWSFINCDLSDARAFSGQPIEFNYCNLANADFSDVSTVIHANGSNFSDIKFNGGTRIYDSTFVNCTLSNEFEATILKNNGKVS